MKIFFDLDGTLADFDNAGGISKMYQKGFFYNLKPYRNGLEIVANLQRGGNDVYILSACIDSPYCKKEKIKWIKKYLPFIKKQNIYLIPVGMSKAGFVKKMFGKIDKNFILFDDYKVNLYEWKKENGIAVKCGKQYKVRPYPQVIEWNKKMLDII